jgi:hypothetical protein
MLCSRNLNQWPWPLTLKINRVPDSPKDYVCTKFGQNPWKDVDSRVFTRMLHGKTLTRWHWPLTLKINSVPDSKGLSMYRVWSKSIEGCWFLSVHKDVTRSKNYPVTLTFDLWHWKSIGSQTLLRTKYVPSLVKIHWRMLILECSQGCYAVKIWPWHWPLTMKINRFPDSPKD